MHPFAKPKKDSTCPNGIVRSSGCASDIRYPVPSAGSSSFFTTWSFYYILIAAGIMFLFASSKLISLQLSSVRAILQNKYVYIILCVLISCGIINSLGVFTASQLMLTDNFNLVNSTGQPVPKDIGMMPSFFHRIQQINLIAHQLPALIAVFLILLLSVCRSPSVLTAKSRSVILFFTILAQLLLIFIWMCVPIHDANNKPLRFIKKINEVYNDPPAYIFGVQAAVVVVSAVCISYAVV